MTILKNTQEIEQFVKKRKENLQKKGISPEDIENLVSIFQSKFPTEVLGELQQLSYTVEVGFSYTTDADLQGIWLKPYQKTKVLFEPTDTKEQIRQKIESFEYKEEMIFTYVKVPNTNEMCQTPC